MRDLRYFGGSQPSEEVFSSLVFLSMRVVPLLVVGTKVVRKLVVVLMDFFLGSWLVLGFDFGRKVGKEVWLRGGSFWRFLIEIKNLDIADLSLRFDSFCNLAGVLLGFVLEGLVGLLSHFGCLRHKCFHGLR